MLFKRNKEAKRSLFRKTVNVFVYAGISFVVLFIIFFGVSQTSTFRNWLKEKVIEEFNNASNGKLFIERIDGTLFTSIILSNSQLTLDDDTIFSAEKIEIKTSPLKAFFKLIYFRKIEIDNADFALMKNENGELNISRLFPPSEEPEDTTSSSFNWSIQVADLTLNNINFKLQSVDKKNSTLEYPQPDFDDLRINNLKLSLTGFADISENQYHLAIANLSMKPNLSGFNLKHFSTNIDVVKDRTEINDLQLVTDRSDIDIDASVNDYSFLDSKEKRKFENAVLELNLQANKFDFDDLTNWISGTDLLNGKVDTDISISGTLNELYINQLHIIYNETSLKGSGDIKNIPDGAGMLINVLFTDSKINQPDVNLLLRNIDIPAYPDYGILQLDTISYTGKPVNFSSRVLLNTDKGKIDVNAALNFENEEMEYDINYETYNLDISPVSGLITNLNGTGSIKGKGTDLKTIESEINLNNNNSSIGGYFLNDFTLQCSAESGKINTELGIISDSLNGKIITSIDMNDSDNPSFSFTGNISQLNLAKILQEDELNTKLNFTIDGEGTGFNPDKMNLFFSLKVDSSYLNDIYINSTRTIVDLRKDENQRVVNLISDLADVTIQGNFTIEDLINLMADKSALLAGTISDKINSFSSTGTSGENYKTANYSTAVNKSFETTLTNEINANYLVELKDFNLISLFLGNADIEVDGEISGEIHSINNEMNVTMNTNIDYFKFWDGNELFFTSGTNIHFKIKDRTGAINLDSLVTDLKIDSKRIFAGTELTDLSLNLELRQEDAKIGFKTNIEKTASTEFDGRLKLEPDKLSLVLDNLSLTYRKFKLKNNSSINISYKPGEVDFQEFELIHKSGKLNIEGIFSPTDSQDLKVKLSNLDAEDIFVELLEFPPEKSPKARINFDAELKGNADLPILNAGLSIDSVRFNNLALGNFTGSANYSSKLLSANLKFQEFQNGSIEQKLNLSADIPIDLSFTNADKVDKNSITAHLKANGFNLAALGNVIPYVSKLNGTFNADVDVTEVSGDVNITGSLALEDVRFVSDLNNLEYELVLDAKLDNNRIDITSFTLNNSHSTSNGGTLTGGGFLTLKNLSPEQIDVFLNGDLLVMNKNSRAVSPTIYGDVKIRTKNNTEYKLINGRSSLTSELILTHGTSINILPLQAGYSNESDQFKYRFIDFSDKTENLETEIDSLIVLTESQKEDSVKSLSIPLDLDIKVEVEDEAKMIMVLSREFNQNLTAYLDGNFQYKTINNIPQASGELNLLEGSKLEFIKTFEAEGSIKFFNDIDNPFLDITASYINFYTPIGDSTQTGADEYEVLIQIKLEGPLKSLSTNLMKNEGNISVYKRPSNRGQFELDQSKTVSDAMMFIIVGKFTDEATAQETNLAASTATSLAGTLVGGVLNQAFGDIVRGFQLRKVGTTTKFSLIGKVPTPAGEVKYEIGGTSQIFQDFSRANIKIEYPTRFLPRLILRIERREPIYETSSFGEMINEIGAKYSFEF